MLEYTILKPEGFLLLKPNESLSKEDFAELSASVDAYLADHASIHGALIHAEAFPGWENFAGLTAHISFVRNHRRKIERVALVTDSPSPAWPRRWPSTSSRRTSSTSRLLTTKRPSAG